MAKLVWDKTGERFYETGVSHGVLYLIRRDQTGTKASQGYWKAIAWNGLTAVTESPSGAEANDLYADDIKYASLRSAETFGATIEAYNYPNEFAKCDGSAEAASGVYLGQQAREMFGFVYKSVIGNDTASESDDGYKLHLIYGATASPSEKAYSTINDSPEAITFSWEITTIPVEVANHKPVSTITIDSRKAKKENLAKLEEILFGGDTSDGWLPMPDEVVNIMTTGEATTTVPESPDILYTTTAVAGNTELFNKKVSELQENIRIGENSISGTLKHVTGYTSFSSDPTKQNGNYLALKISDYPKSDKITVTMVGDEASGKPVELDDDRQIVLLIHNNKETIKISSVKNTYNTTKTYSLRGLVLNNK